jgi:dipeptidyl aminopeptidase/acylaminoacyl peptidase
VCVSSVSGHKRVEEMSTVGCETMPSCPMRTIDLRPPLERKPAARPLRRRASSDGGGQRRLTRDAAPSYDLAWSPDGRKIAFMSKRDGTWDVHLMNADGSGQRNLTRGPAYDGNPAWSPDGRKIAFGRDGEIYVMNADGSGQRNLTRSPWNEARLPGRPRRRSST